MDPLVREFIDDVLCGSPVAKALDATLCACDVDDVTVRVPYGDHLTTVPWTVHGGVISTLIDIAGAAASASGVSTSSGAKGGATAHLSVSFLRPAVASDLEAHAVVVRRSRESTQSHVKVRDAEGRVVAAGQVSSRIFY